MKRTPHQPRSAAGRRRLAGVIALALTAAGLVLPATAAAPPHHAKRYYVAKVVPFEVKNPDGTVISGSVYLPNTPRGKKLGTVLDLSPYWSGEYASPDLEKPDHTLKDLFDWFIADGHAFAAVSIRGTGNSTGCMDFGGRTDQGDAFKVVEGLAKQSWSNGKIGMFGGSYEGWTQSMAIAAHPPHLAAIVPVSSIVDYWNLLTSNGAAFAGASALWPTLAADGNPASLTGCPGLAEHAVKNEGVNVDLDRDAYFKERYYLDDFAKSKVPVFVTGGLRELRVYAHGTGVEGDGHISQINDLWKLLPKGNRQMVIGPWSHDYPFPIGMPRTQADARFRAQLSAWWDNYIGDKPARSGLFDSVIYQDDQGSFHTSRQWPPTPRLTDLPLSGGQILGPHANPTTSSSQFQTGDNYPLGPDVPDPGPGNCGPTQVVYSSAPLQQEVQLAGDWYADLTLQSTLPGGHLVAELFAMPQSQPKLNALAGEDLCTTPGVREIGRAVTSLQHWKYTGTGAPFPVATPTRVPLRGNPFATVVRRGERLVLVVAAHQSTVTSFPMKPLITVQTGHQDGSSLRLPVVNGSLQL